MHEEWPSSSARNSPPKPLDSTSSSSPAWATSCAPPDVGVADPGRSSGSEPGCRASAISTIERGRGGSHTLDTWQRLALAVDRPMRIELRRDAREEPADAGHLAIQELVLRLGRRAGFSGTFELPTRSSDPSRSTDVGLRDDRARLLILVECWNTFGDLGASIRSTNRKLAEAAELAIAVGGDDPHRVVSCWVVRDVERNRQLLARYPELFASQVPGLIDALGSSPRGLDVREIRPLTRCRPPAWASSGAMHELRACSPGALGRV